METVQLISVSDICPGNNDRKNFDQVDLLDLAQSIKANGLAQPITIRPIENPNYKFEIVAGERRFRAISKVLNWDAIPSLVRELSDEEASAIMLVENTGRADLNPIEQSDAFQARIDKFGWSIEKISEVAGVSVDLVKRRLSLQKLCLEARHLAAHGNLPIGHAEAITSLDNNRQRIAMRIFNQNPALPFNQFKHIVNDLLEEQSQDSLFDLENFWVEQVQKEEMPTRGKRAFTGAPSRKDLPPVQMMENGNSTSILIANWIADLQEKGFTQEAETVGTLYNSLVHLNYLSVPPSSKLTQNG
jgi:ParB/RepB/Spo0J family partition protein